MHTDPSQKWWSAPACTWQPAISWFVNTLSNPSIQYPPVFFLKAKWHRTVPIWQHLGLKLINEKPTEAGHDEPLPQINNNQVETSASSPGTDIPLDDEDEDNEDNEDDLLDIGKQRGSNIQGINEGKNQCLTGFFGWSWVPSPILWWSYVASTQTWRGRPIMVGESVSKQGEEDAVNERGDTISMGAINKQCNVLPFQSCTFWFQHTCLWKLLRRNIVLCLDVEIWNLIVFTCI